MKRDLLQAAVEDLYLHDSYIILKLNLYKFPGRDAAEETTI